MTASGIRIAALLVVACLCGPRSAAGADVLFIPFVGGAFGGRTAFLNLEQGAGATQLIVGGSAQWLSTGFLGVEVDFAYAPRFFERDNIAGTILDSAAATFGGAVIVAVPSAVTGYSLRPYAVGGLGLIHSAITYSALLDPIDDNSLGLNLGGGAIGLLARRTGVRFELRHFRTLEREANQLSGDRKPLLSFWRATVGVVFVR